MTSKQVLRSAEEELETIIYGMRAAFDQWERGDIDADEYGEKIADAMYALDDYRQAYAPTALQRFLQDREHADELARDVFRDAQEDYQ